MTRDVKGDGDMQDAGEHKALVDEIMEQNRHLIQASTHEELKKFTLEAMTPGVQRSTNKTLYSDVILLDGALELGGKLGKNAGPIPRLRLRTDRDGAPNTGEIDKHAVGVLTVLRLHGLMIDKLPLPMLRASVLATIRQGLARSSYEELTTIRKDVL